MSGTDKDDEIKAPAVIPNRGQQQNSAENQPKGTEESQTLAMVPPLPSDAKPRPKE